MRSPNSDAAIWSDPFTTLVASGKPFLGICLGLQLLFDVGRRRASTKGLGFCDGKVVRFELPSEYKVPHMGWNQLHDSQRPADPRRAC